MKLMKLINDLSKNTRKRMAFLMVKRGSKHDRVICNLDNGSLVKSDIETLFRMKKKDAEHGS